MRRVHLVFFLLGAISPLASAQLSGTTTLSGSTYLNAPSSVATISNVQETASASTIAVSFTTSVFATPGFACGTVSGTYTIAAKDEGIDVLSPVNHVQIVAGLNPSTVYYCQYSAANGAGTSTGTFSIATTAVPASTPITGLSLGSVTGYNSINASNQGAGDTFYNCKSNDGYTYMTSDDNSGFTISGSPAFNGGGQQSLMRVLSESPLTIQTIQAFTAYGDEAQPTYLADGLSSKNTGLFCMGGYLFLAIGRQNQSATQTGGGLQQSYGNVIYSADHGASFNNPQSVGDFRTVGNPTNPLSFSMFGSSPTDMATAEFVHYCADDGTLGYFVACNQHDQGDAYVYLIANEGTWTGGGSAGGGNALYLARVPRAKLRNLSGADYQWYTSGDGTQDSSWSAQTNAAPIISNAGKLGEPNVQFIPALNRYLLLTYYYPSGVVTNNGGNRLDSVWLGYESPHPWGPWTQIFSQEFSGTHGGAYNPVILNDTAYTGTAPTVVWTGNFVNVSDYQLYFATLTIAH